MLVPGFAGTFSLLETYIGKRPRRGPFPLESALTWSILLNTQSLNEIRGSVLEIGVEFGTSAFLLLEALHPGEHATLIDLATTRDWMDGINGPYRDQADYTFIVGNTLHMEQSQLPGGCRWIHIDGGHLHRHVLNDLQLTANSLSEDGILVLDDFFEIRWPDVTFAAMEYLKDNEQIFPFLLVNRKLYCPARSVCQDIRLLRA